MRRGAKQTKITCSNFSSVKKAIEIGPYDSSEEIKVDTGTILNNKESMFISRFPFTFILDIVSLTYFIQFKYIVF